MESKKEIIIPLLPFHENGAIPQPDAHSGKKHAEVVEPPKLRDYQVVRTEFISQRQEPALTFKDMQFFVNQACLKRFPDVDAVHMLVQSESKTLVLLPCDKDAPHAFAWCHTTSKGRRVSRQVTCKILSAKIFDLMGWNAENRYKVLGKIVHDESMRMLLFDLTGAEVYQRVYTDESTSELSRQARYPEDWRDQFGPAYEEHRQLLQFKLIEEYAMYTIKETKPEMKTVGLAEVDTDQNTQESKEHFDERI